MTKAIVNALYYRIACDFIAKEETRYYLRGRTDRGAAMGHR
jgi:hypothetical protein